MPRRKQRSRALLAIILPLIAVALCGGISMLLFAPRPADAVAELKLLDIYRSATAVSISDNSHYQKAEALWSYKNSGGTIWTDKQRNLDATVATMTFQTNDEPEHVQAFYAAQASRRKYDEVVPYNTIGTQYLRYEDPYDVGGIMDIIEDNLHGCAGERPITFYELTIVATRTPTLGGSGSALTQVEIDARIMQETGGVCE